MNNNFKVFFKRPVFYLAILPLFHMISISYNLPILSAQFNGLYSVERVVHLLPQSVLEHFHEPKKVLNTLELSPPKFSTPGFR